MRQTSGASMQTKTARSNFRLFPANASKKSFIGGIDDFDSWCFLQDIVKELDQFTHYKGGRNIPDHQHNYQ